MTIAATRNSVGATKTGTRSSFSGLAQTSAGADVYQRNTVRDHVQKALPIMAIVLLAKTASVALRAKLAILVASLRATGSASK
eukprot:CAMPEP_0197659944 /NCGR_PEP_ID=MMETSP1338-20131121/49811_1 /TAXON_ID=43686 ORGANISM="Pelagodinium beii, Strain RCC1491" /NCGR_SAMPLE_ID=MMETSP1338 /ASSEMBLY_ACC=CAM_ASM_000754 /LENGTH=82 /DNA_ID=CAMNT_0043237145 /DNA_START=432 /DNA_END=680 /DNA_ORIENTATION=+